MNVLFYTRNIQIRQLYRHLANDFHFIPIGTETLGTYGPEAIKFLEDLGHKLGLINGEKRSNSLSLFTVILGLPSSISKVKSQDGIRNTGLEI